MLLLHKYFLKIFIGFRIKNYLVWKHVLTLGQKYLNLRIFKWCLSRWERTQGYTVHGHTWLPVSTDDIWAVHTVCPHFVYIYLAQKPDISRILLFFRQRFRFIFCDSASAIKSRIFGTVRVQLRAVFSSLFLINSSSASPLLLIPFCSGQEDHRGSGNHKSTLYQSF